MARWRRAGLWLLIILGFVAIAGSIVFQSPWLRDKLRRVAMAQATTLLNGELTIGRLEGSLLHDVTLDDVTLTQSGGQVFHAKRVVVRYDAWILLHEQLIVDAITIDEPSVRLVQTSAGWNVANLIRERRTAGEPVDFTIRRLQATDGDVEIVRMDAAPRHVRDVDATMSLSRAAGRLTTDLTSVSLHDDGSNYDLTSLQGHLANGIQSVDLRFAATRPPAKVSGRVTSNARPGEARQLDASLDLTKVDLQDLLASASWQSDVSIHADVGATLPADGQPIVRFKVKGPHARAFGYEGTDLVASGSWTAGRLAFDASADGYGGSATVTAVWQVTEFQGARPEFDGRGTFASVSLSRLPAQLKLPRLASRLGGDYRVHFDSGGWHASVVLGDSIVEGARIAAGTAGTVAARSGETYYSASGSLSDLDLNRIATPIDVAALAEPRYQSRLTGTFSVNGREGCRGCAVPRWIVARARMADAQVADTTLHDMTAGLALVGPTLSVVARGRTSHLSNVTIGAPNTPALELNGEVDGSFVWRDVHAPFDITGVDVDARAQLGASKIAGVAIEKATVDAAIADGLATIRQAHAEGAGIVADACGTAALGDTGTSALDVTMDTDDLRAAGDLANQPIRGTGHLELHVTGPRDQPEATGRVSLRSFAYGEDVTALTFNSDVRATVPNWELADARVSLKSDATFVKIKGFELVRAGGETTYARDQVDLTLDLADTSRELRVAGQLALAPEARALTVNSLALSTGGETWSLPAGMPAVIRGDASHFEVRDLALVNGAQKLTVDGALAIPADAPPQPGGLRVTIDRVQLASANRMVLGTRRLEGVLGGEVTVSGSAADPDVHGRVGIDQGSVEGTPFQSLRAEGTLAKHDLTFDATLVQSGENELRASGHVPVGTGAADSPRPMDVKVTSTPIDLGLAQLVTDAVSNIAGTARLDLQITGSPRTPSIDGTLRIDGAAFTLVGSGVRYTGSNAALTFKSNRLTIDQLRLTDDDGHALTATGALDILGEAASRAFDVSITADDVHVLNNDLGSLTIKGTTRLSGDLAAPKIEGSLRIDSGRLEVDRILQKTTNNPYSETPAETGLTELNVTLPSETPPAPPETPAKPAASPSVFSRVALDLTVHLPDNLVMRGRGLRVGRSAVGLGDMNVIAGGTVRVRKSPGDPLDVVGDMEVIRGTYTFQGRRFEVQRGSQVRFRGGDPVDPALDVAAERDVSGVAATVHVRGSAKRPELTLSSEPPLDEAEIMSLIVFGQPLGDLGSSQRTSLAEQVGVMAAGAITTPIADSIAQALDLDLFEILAPSGSEQLPVVSVGTQIGSRVYIAAKREIGGENASVSFEYRFARFLRLVTSFAQGALQAHTLERNEAAGIDLLFVFRY